MFRRSIIWLLAATFSWSANHAAWAQSKFLKHFSLISPAGQITPAIPDNSVSHIVTQGSTIWIGTGNGLARSSDGGASWESFSAVPQFASPGIFAIAVLGDTVWSSTGFTEDLNGQSVQTGSGYAFSIDNGISWTHVPQTLDAQGDTIVQYGTNRIHFLPVIVPQQNVTFDLALEGNTVWIASWASGLRKSTDRGRTWQRTVLPNINLNTISPSDQLTNYSVDPRQDNNFLMFSVFPQDSTIVWAGSAGGVNRSTDGGMSWAKYTTTNQLAHILGNWVIAIAGQKIGAIQRTWITDWPTDSSEQYGVSYSDDDGRTWNNFLNGVKAYAFAFRDTIAYIASDNGLYRTADGGRSWDLSGAVIDQKTGDRLTTSAFFGVGVVGDTVYGGTSDGIARTVDDGTRPFGATWDLLRASRAVGAGVTAYAYPNPFTPRNEISRIHYSTGASSASVTIELFDFGMNRVRTVIKDAQRTGNADHDEIWDGKNDAKSIVPNGVYFYRITFNGGNPVWGKVMVLQ